ncbi:MAG: efflux RND transporter periplasmic adaptor subunit [candidate division WOR-3 bacterium]|nr:efflux RND transporter periplasmic adaptor subunit [candidate division WOR-3 bacterium]MCX7757583.1 efflux RND transporter periplasmic adaptor subunit [candidate division WOR-3 bacterium]MDW7987618.1 efflux RND transporter periplasmic adaptor subunit [candidate division WOR-3 bacterium]
MKKIIVSVFIILAVLVSTSYVFYNKKRNTKWNKNTNQEVFEVRKGNLEVKVLATGTIKPYTRVEVKSPANGRVEQVLVDEGFQVKPGDVLAWISSEERVALLDVARAILDEAQKSKNDSVIQEAQKSFEIAQRAYKPIPVTNSIAGEVIVRSCEPGQNVSTQTTLFVISDRLTASVSVDETDIGKIKLGQLAMITLDAFPENQISGRVVKIAKEGMTVSDVVVYNVMVEPMEVPNYWASGMTANVEFLAFRKDNVLLVPIKAVKHKGNQKYVTVVKEKHWEDRIIETGYSDGRFVEVLSGLQEGDKVLILQGTQPARNPSGFQRIQPMMRMIR